jgi:RNA polymerase sigma-70 factor (ECF subfamily)
MGCCSEAEVLRAPARSVRGPHILDPEGLSRHLDTLYRAAWALCGTQHDAEDLVQETLVNVLKRPRLLRDGNELGYLLRALRNTFSTRYRVQAQRPIVHRLCEHDAVAMPDQEHSAREIIEAIARRSPAPRRCTATP